MASKSNNPKKRNSEQLSQAKAKKGIGRKDFFKKLGAGLVAPAVIPSLSFRSPDHTETDRPNVVVIFDDQLRQDVLGVYGGGENITTPNLDRLANEGMTFRNNISTCPLCTPFRGMLMTGRYPTHSGVIFNFVQASPEQNPHCLANAFGDAGYDTGFIGKWHLANGWRTPEGLHHPDKKARQTYRKNHETEFVPPGPERLGYQHWQAYNFHVAFKNYWYYEDKPKKIYSDKYETNTEFDQAISYMESHKNSSDPFLLTVAPHPPHPPFRKYPEGSMEKVASPDQIKWNPNVPEKNNPRSVEGLRGYYAMCKNFDENVGQLLDYLDRSGQAENTIVIVTADHGEMHGSHGRVNKMVPYREAIKTPLIMRWPGHIPESRFSDAIFRPIDIMPTLCGLTDTSIPEEVDGDDLSEVVKGKEYSSREAALMMNYTSHWDFLQTETLWPEWRGVFTERYTYVKWLNGKEELYDDGLDPYQMDNIIDDPDHADKANGLRNRLTELLNEADDDFRPGDEYDEWFDDQRNLVKTALGPVPSS